MDFLAGARSCKTWPPEVGSLRRGRGGQAGHRSSICGFLAGSIAAIFSVFPMAILGAMMLLVGLELTKFAGDIEWGPEIAPLVVTVAVSLLTNMFVGFLAGLAAHHLIRRATSTDGA